MKNEAGDSINQEVRSSVPMKLTYETDGISMGISNVDRSFLFAAEDNNPTVIWRNSTPFAGFVYGFSSEESDGISTGDFDAAVNTSVTPGNASLYPVTPVADAFNANAWPVFDNLFTAATGKHGVVPFSAFVRYTAMVTRAYTLLRTVMLINHLAYHFDWKSVAPFTDVVPNNVYDLSGIWDADDASIQAKWLPLMRRLETKILPPTMVAEIKRQTQPMLSIDLNGRLLVNYQSVNTLTDPGDLFAAVADLLEYIEVSLSQYTGVIMVYLPYTLGSSDPWAFVPEAVIDVERATGWYNSGLAFVNPFGDTGDPVPTNSLMFTEQESNPQLYETSLNWWTRSASPTWGEVKEASIFTLYENLTDDVYSLSSLHRHTYVTMLDRANNGADYDGTAVTGDLLRYSDYTSCRFRNGDFAGGISEPGYMGASIASSQYFKMLSLEVENQFTIPALRQVVANMAGSSVREIRDSVMATFQTGIARTLA